ncbi:MAG: hypothetical protein KF691_14830 [Phycisphaeraceae bacterium]|nr:hypothetical protein [Phycisphaeraceae bacterium]
MKHRILLAILLTLGGCTMTYTDPVLSSDNPANPVALESPPPPRSSALDLAAAEPVYAPKKETDHSGHGMSNMAMPPEHESSAGQSTSAPSNSSASQAPVIYSCPMHPEVTSDKPDQRCPKCNMKLKPISAIKAKQGEPK